MKTFAGKLIALLLSAAMILGAFAGCELLEVNTERDMEQVIASVNIDMDGDETAYKIEPENIYKRELISGYVTYGYMYVQNYGYTLSKTYDLILSNLTNNKVIVQYSRKKLSEAGKTYTSSAVTLPEEKYVSDGMMKTYYDYVKELLKFVTESQAAEAEYNVLANFANMTKSFEEKKDDKKETEDEKITARTVPTVTTDGTAIDEEYAKSIGKEGLTEEKMTDEEKTAYDAWKKTKYTEYKKQYFSKYLGGVEKKAAFDSLTDSFETLGLFGKAEVEALKNDNKQYEVQNYCYYVYLLASNLESFVIQNYEDLLEATAAEGVVEDALYSEYVNMFNEQKEKYTKDLSSYETALDGITADSYVLYNPTLASGDKYGYVANILIGFSAEATAALEAFTEYTDGAKKEYRKELLKTLTAKDLRATWVQNAYGTSSESEFTFDDDRVKTDLLKKFNGTVTGSVDKVEGTKSVKYFQKDGAWVWEEKAEETDKANFTEITATEMTFSAFIENVFKPALGLTSAVDVDTKYDNAIDVETYKDAINDLMFAYSTDTGCLNKLYGYFNGIKSNNFVPEFKEAAQEVINAGEGSFKIVATDYGYHIIICTKVMEANENGEYASEAEFKADLNNEGSTAAKLLKVKKSSNLEKLVSDTVSYNISKFVEDGTEYITKYKKTFKNLITEE